MIIGVDEVGYGCVAGDMAAGVAVCHEGQKWKEVRDSKKLSPSKRSRAFELLHRELAFWAVVYGGVDDINARRAGVVRFDILRRAAQLALDRFPGCTVIVDGNQRLEGIPRQIAVPRADDQFPVVSAASIVAKVLRDRYMTTMASVYPDYGFETHKGYGTVQHMEAIRDLGPCPLHRTSYQLFSDLSS